MWPSDEELMLSYRDGDEYAFEMLYRRYEKPLLNFIYRVVMNAADAENLCQEAFFRVVRGKKKYQATAQFKAWLFQIALNLCRDKLRRMKHRSHLSLNVLTVSQDDEDAELQEAAQQVEKLVRAVTVSSRDGAFIDPASHVQAFKAAMERDLDTPSALLALDGLVDAILQGGDVDEAQAALRHAGSVFGLRLDAEAPETRVRSGWSGHLERFSS